MNCCNFFKCISPPEKCNNRICIQAIIFCFNLVDCVSDMKNSVKTEIKKTVYIYYYVNILLQFLCLFSRSRGP